ncbi:hypothetical protein [Pseudomonas sp. TWR1-1-4]|uniref:hypothetical protein n=1 Tax=Pseudomonas sp. TWR1-1-4 TaxID=2804604 RepID=UPI003CF84116
MKKFIFLVALASIFGCTSIQTPHERADPVPAARIYSNSKKSDAQLVMLLKPRLEGFCKVSLLIDGRRAADFHPGEISYFGTTFGKHFLEVQPVANCTSFKSSSTTINVKSGDALLMVITPSAIEPVSL